LTESSEEPEKKTVK